MSLLFIELGLAVVGLAVLVRLANRWGAAIPLSGERVFIVYCCGAPSQTRCRSQEPFLLAIWLSDSPHFLLMPHRVFWGAMFVLWLSGAGLFFTILMVISCLFAFTCLLISWHSHRAEQSERESLRRHVRSLR